MISEKVKKLAQIEARAAKLKNAIEREQARELAALPAKYGYASAKEFVAAVKAASGKAGGRRRKRRSRITAEIKEAIVKSLKGGKTAGAAAKVAGVSIASVNLIKKAAGLVKPRK